MVIGSPVERVATRPAFFAAATKESNPMLLNVFARFSDGISTVLMVALPNLANAALVGAKIVNGPPLRKATNPSTALIAAANVLKFEFATATWTRLSFERLGTSRLSMAWTRPLLAFLSTYTTCALLLIVIDLHDLVAVNLLPWQVQKHSPFIIVLL